MNFDTRTLQKWIIVVLLCAIAYVIGGGTSAVYAGCGTEEACRQCALDECDPEEQGNYYSFAHSGSNCNACCTTDCSDQFECDCGEV